MISKHTTLCSILISLCLLGCRQGDKVSDNNRFGNGEQKSVNTSELPMPDVPDSLQSVEERAAYVVAHYWDAMDFTDRALSLDTAFIEQNFANFAAILPMSPPDEADRAVAALVSRAGADPKAFSLIASTAEKYLDDPNSPMRDEETYIHFLRHISEAPFLSDVERIRPRHRLADALKNRPGSQAADFGFVDRSGSSTTLMRELAPNPLNLLIFYDPDCSQCKEIMGRLSALALPQEVGIIAVDVEDDHDAWQRTKDSLPARWQVGFATTPVLYDGLYVLAASPTLYLLDSTGKVILKDPPVDQAIAALTR